MTQLTYLIQKGQSATYFWPRKGYFFIPSGLNFFAVKGGGDDGFPKSSISIHFVFLRVALVNTESVVGSGCLWACGELGANIHSVSGRRRSRREVLLPGFRMFLPMQIEFSLRLSTV